MNKILQRWEKSFSTWFLLATVMIFFLLRLPSLIEPYWYGDEGIYETIGRALLNGKILYSGIWDNKPPLLYFTYELFNSSQFSVRFISMLVGIAAVIVFFLLAKKIFTRPLPIYLSTIIFTLLFATPATEANIANAENFMLLPILIAGYLIYSYSSKLDLSKHNLNPFIFNTRFLILFSAGLLLSVAFLYKIVALFDFAAFAVFISYLLLPQTNSLKIILKKKTFMLLFGPIIPYTLGFIIPILITVLYFFANNAGMDFLRSVFVSNIGYVNYGNAFIIPQGLLVIKLLLLCGFLLFLFTQRKALTAPVMFVLIWFSFALFDIYFSQRNYTHYFLMLIPSLSLLFGLPSIISTYKKKYLILGCAFILALYAFNYFIGNRYSQLPSYYANFLSYITDEKSVTQYQNYFDRNTSRDYMIADYLRMNTNPNAKVFIWGNSAQIYTLSDTLPVGRYTVEYHIQDNSQAEKETENALISEKPKFVIVLNDTPNYPFPSSDYSSRLSLNGNIIYERDATPIISR